MLRINPLLLIIVGVFILSSVPLSESTLWDLLISVNVINAPLEENDNPLIFGTIVDHAGKPIENVSVQIRSGQNTVLTTTNELGEFHHEYTGLELLPGEHVVNVIANSNDGKMGVSSTNFQVKGELNVSSHTARLLETDEAKKYLNANPEDFANNPIGIQLYNYYQDLQSKFIEQEAMQDSINNLEIELDEKRAISDNLEQKIIEEKNPGAGTFSGWKYDVFIANLDPSIRDLVSKQMNFTVDVFEGAQSAMNEVLENGGTYQEARMAYLEKATVSREMMEMITYGNQTAQLIEITNSTLIQNSTSIQNSTISEEPKIDEVAMNLNGTEIQVGLSGTTIFLNVNGTLIEFLVNGTEIIPITNSTQN